jgi:FtsZ-binding cell division protein ZapB
MSLQTKLEQDAAEADAAILANAQSSTPKPDTDDKQEQPKNDGTPKNSEEPQKFTDSEATWEARYKALRGKYDAEVPRLRKQLEEKPTASFDDTALKQEIADLKQKNADLEQQLASSTPTKAEVDDYFVSEFGEETAQALNRFIESRLANQGNASELQKKVEQLEQQNAQVRTESINTMLTNTLKTRGIDFQEVNDDPMFLDWLQHEEGNTGRTRHSFLQQHYSNGDVERTASYFIGFKAHERSLVESNPLNQHIDMSSTNIAPDTPNNGSVWTQADVDRLYDDYLNKRIDQATFDKYEQDLFRAQAEGRYQG